jgi:hypothetical protein
MAEWLQLSERFVSDFLLDHALADVADARSPHADDVGTDCHHVDDPK